MLISASHTITRSNTHTLLLNTEWVQTHYRLCGKLAALVARPWETMKILLMYSPELSPHTLYLLEKVGRVTDNKFTRMLGQI